MQGDNGPGLNRNHTWWSWHGRADVWGQTGQGRFKLVIVMLAFLVAWDDCLTFWWYFDCRFIHFHVGEIRDFPYMKTNYGKVETNVVTWRALIGYMRYDKIIILRLFIWGKLLERPVVTPYVHEWRISSVHPQELTCVPSQISYLADRIYPKPACELNSPWRNVILWVRIASLLLSAYLHKQAER